MVYNNGLSGYTGNITYKADKTISEVNIVQAGTATIDDKYNYTGNTTTIHSSIIYNYGNTLQTTSTITKNNSGQVTSIRFSDGAGEGDIYDFTYSGKTITSASVTRLAGTDQYPGGTVIYSYDNNGNLLSLVNNDTGQHYVSFEYDDTMPAQQGDLFGYY